VGGGGRVGGFPPCPHLGVAIKLLASCHCACYLYPGVSEVEVGSGVVGGNDGCV
jgi:hypothetical protein